MKKIIPIILFLLTLSCERDFEEINTNPDAFANIEPEYLFSGVVLRTLNIVADLNRRTCWSYSHYLSIEGGPLPRYSATPVGMSAWWDRFYVDILSNLNQIIEKYAEDPAYANRMQMAYIWRSYVYSIVVSTWGPVPYFETFEEGLESYKYDSEEEIYTDLLNTLKTASEELDPEGDFFTPDKVFSDVSDNALVDSWIRFANSLRLKIAIRISDVNPTLAQQHISELLANEDKLVSSNSENIKAYWGTEINSFSPYYQDYNPEYNAVGTGIYPFLSHYLYLYLRSYGDARMTKFATKSVSPYAVTDTFWIVDITVPPVPAPNDTVALLIQYPLNYFGRPKTGRIPDIWGVTDPLPLPSKDFMYAPVNVDFLDMDDFHLIISYADICFIKAEAAFKGYGGSRSAEEYYYEGIQASFEQYGLEESDYEKYIAHDGISWGTSGIGFEDFRGIVSSSINGDPMTQIITQRWIANYFYGGHDAWIMQRRTKILDFPPHFNPESPTTTSVLAADQPERLPYPAVELNLNSATQDAINTYFDGKNDMNGKLYFSKEYEFKDWLSMIPRINNDFVKYFYGDQVENLDSAGVDYDILKYIKYRSVD